LFILVLAGYALVRFLRGHRRSILLADADPVYAGQMDDGVGAGHAGSELVDGRQVTDHERRSHGGKGGRTGGIADDRDDRVATPGQEPDDRSADESAPTRDEDAQGLAWAVRAEDWRVDHSEDGRGRERAAAA